MSDNNSNAEETETVDHIVMEGIAYTDDADLEIESDGGEPRVANHDELVEQGKTKYEAIALADTESNREIIAEDDIVEPSDDEWTETYSELDVGESVEIVT